VAKTSFFALFVIDATISCVVALLFLMLMPETRQQGLGSTHRESVVETFRNYPDVIRDKAFSAFLAACMLMGVVYIQMYNTLSVYLRDVNGIQAQGYGFLLTTSAITVILLQIPVIGAIRARPQFLMMALGTAFYAVGFGMFALIARYWLFMAAIVIITVGEMIVMPTSQALAAGFARVHMRGRYMAAFGLTQHVPAAVGPAAAGFVLDHLNPDLLWVFGSILCTVALAGFCALHVRLGSEPRFAAHVDRTQLLEA
jgi:MFS family permease